jgi:hypothetical protein
MFLLFINYFNQHINYSYIYIYIYWEPLISIKEMIKTSLFILLVHELPNDKTFHSHVNRIPFSQLYVIQLYFLLTLHRNRENAET